MRYVVHIALAGAIALGGCATKPKKTVASLDETAPKYSTPECVAARKAALEHSDHTIERIGVSVAAHLLLGPFALPVTVVSHEQKYDAREKVNRQVVLACVTDGEEIIAARDAEAKAAQDARDEHLIAK